MYNETIKKQYISAFSDRNQVLPELMTAIFSKLEKYEKSLNKDACCFTVPEILGYYKFLCTPSIERLENINSQLGLYTAFCLKEHIIQDGQNHYNELNREVLYSCVNEEYAKKRIITRAELLDVLKNLNNPVDKVLLLGQFEGINGNGCSEFIGMKAEDISKNIITLNSGRKLTISNELISYINEAAETYSYYALSDNTDRSPAIYKLEEYDKNVFKVKASGMRGESVSPSLIERRMIMLKKYIGAVFISRKALQASGRIEYIRNLMETKHMTLDEALRDPGLNERYTKIQSFQRFKMKYASYFEGE